MSWEPAERVQKNDRGEYRAFIGGAWVPVQRAQKNEAGQYRVERFQREPMAEPEFEKEAKQIVAGSTLGGVAAEALKGVPRGIVDVGSFLAKAVAGDVLVSPEAPSYRSKDVDILAGQAKGLFPATPSGPGEAVAGALGEVAGSYIAPSIPGAVVKTAGRAVTPVVRTARNFIDPMLPGGSERAVGRTLLKLAGEKRPQVIAALGEPSTIVPGSVPTAAEAAAKAGSAEFSGAQRVIEKGAPTPYSDIASAQEGARQGAIQAFGKTPQQLEKAIADRAKEAKDLYEKASNQVLIMDDKLKSLLETDSMKKAMKRVESIETEVGKARPSPEGTMSVGKLHYLKMAMDDFLKDPDKFGIAGLETAAYQGTRKALVEWITTRSPDYEKARLAFTEASKPINVMQVGQQLEKSLTAPLATSERPGPFATAMREAPKTIEKATKSPRFTNLEQAVGKENTAAAEAVLADLARAGMHDKLASAGASKASELIKGAVPQVPPSGMFSPIYSVFRTVFNRFAGKLTDNELDVLSKVMQTPKETLKLMNAAAAREALTLSMIRAKVPPLTMSQQLRAGGAGVAAGQVQE